FFAAAIVALIAAIISFLYLQEPQRRKEALIKEKTSGLKRVFNPLYFIAFIIIFIASLGFAAFDFLISLFVAHKFGFTRKDIVIIITGGGLVEAFAQVVLFDSLTNLIGEIKLIRYAFVFSAILVMITTMVQAYVSILLATIFIFVGFDLMRPAEIGRASCRERV